MNYTYYCCTTASQFFFWTSWATCSNYMYVKHECRLLGDFNKRPFSFCFPPKQENQEINLYKVLYWLQNWIAHPSFFVISTSVLYMVEALWVTMTIYSTVRTYPFPEVSLLGAQLLVLHKYRLPNFLCILLGKLREYFRVAKLSRGQWRNESFTSGFRLDLSGIWGWGPFTIQ